ncbi:MAG: hypothetical protein HY900_01410 [Deltaproteobacteria bacterium]|nr:hypothetical protein [Deltaproteobacteria bacterium]
MRDPRSALLLAGTHRSWARELQGELLVQRVHRLGALHVPRREVPLRGLNADLRAASFPQLRSDL